MWSPGYVRVISSPSNELLLGKKEDVVAGSHCNSDDDDVKHRMIPSVKLKDLFDAPEWIDAVEKSPLSEHLLISIPYETFISSPKSRVLSYRWSNKVTLDCAVNDPAGVLTRFKGELALSVLQTPCVGYSWEMLWADALNHLNHPESIQMSVRTMGDLYLQAITLPQYFLIGDPNSAQEAIRRGWMHQELAYGALDRQAVDHFIGTCAQMMDPGQWRGCPFYLPSFLLLSEFVAKRLTSCAKNVDPKSDFAKQVAPTYIDACFCILSLWLIAHELPTSLSYYRGMESQEAEELMNHFLDEVCAKQVSDDILANQKSLDTNPVFAWCIIRAAANTNFWDKSDVYVASTAIIGRACGIDVLDPLGDYKARFNNESSHPTNADGTWAFSPPDVNLSVLNANLSILQRCWRTLGKLKGWSDIPNSLRPISEDQMVLVNLHKMPFGMHTMGVGPILIEDIVFEPFHRDKRRKVGLKAVIGSFGMIFAEKLDYYEIATIEQKKDAPLKVHFDSEESCLFTHHHVDDTKYLLPILEGKNSNIQITDESERIHSELSKKNIPWELMKIGTN